MHGGTGILEIIVGTDNQDHHVGVQFTGLFGKLQTIHIGHADIRDQKVWRIFADLFPGFVSINSSSSQLDT